MITRLRRLSKSLLRPVAEVMAKNGITGNSLTLTGLVLSLTFPAFIYFKFYVEAIIIVVVASLFDAFDGEVARIRKEAGKKGSFLDSVSDRIEDLSYVTGLFFLGLPPLLLILLAGTSVIISYVRAKAESLGVALEGKGIVERGERLLFVVIIVVLYLLFLPATLPVLYIFVILSCATVVQRILLGVKAIH
ncbi:CDP-alcohol phosphatidyltransferase [Sulfolobales archaeon HS-7]|nr:CDP-alcohol phosphatidyltransferase [Sulfolobales archaeon HS-7]